MECDKCGLLESECTCWCEGCGCEHIQCVCDFNEKDWVIKNDKL